MFPCLETDKKLMHMKIDYKGTIDFVDGWSPETLRHCLEAAKHIVLTAHQNADGDAVGSVMGLYAILRRATKASLTPMLPDGCPDDLRWMPHSNLILSGKTDIERCRRAIGDADLIVCMDLSDLDRTGVFAEMLKEATASRLLFDHHIGSDRENFAITVADPEISSTCELIFWAMKLTFGCNVIGPDAAKSLYAGICTDTGTFSYSNRHKSLYLAAAELSQMGIDPMEINRDIKNVFTVNRLKFFGYAMSQLLEVYPRQEAALMVIGREDTDRYGVESADLTGLVNEVMKLKDIDCAVLIREEKDRVRLSLRSKCHFDVNRLAHQLFGGGGHERAAGATSTLSLEATVEKVKSTLQLN